MSDPTGRSPQLHNQDDIDRAWQTVGPLPPPWPRPVLVVLSGLPGSGKSYLARKLAERVPMAIVSTDAVRLALFLPPRYTWQESRTVYEVCHVLIDELLAKGVPTIFDATNLIERYRQTVYDIARKNDAKLVIVETVSPPEVIMERMGRRALGEDLLDKSEADWDIHLRMKETAQPIKPDHFTVDTSQDLEPELDRIVEAIRN